MTFRSLYRKKRATSFCFLIAIIIFIALYRKATLNFYSHQNFVPRFHLQWKAENSVLFSILGDFKTFEKDSHQVALPDTNDIDIDDGHYFAPPDWKINKINFYLNNTHKTSVFPAFGIGRYLLFNSKLCKDVATVHILIIVHTAGLNFEKRQRIRQTFGNSSLFRPFEVRVVFLLGKSRTDREQHLLLAEHIRHSDIVMGDFYDDYHNLTLKGVMGFRWISKYCSNARFILKIDDDVIVDMYKVLNRYLPHMEGKKKSIFCNVWRKNMVIEREGKWKVPSNIFSNTTMFPFYYCSGFTLILSRDLIFSLYKAAKLTPLFWIDDIYLFGILPFVVGGVTYHNYEIGMNISLEQEETYKCWTEQGLGCSHLSTLVSDDDFQKFWHKIQELHDHRSWQAMTFFEQ